MLGSNPAGSTNLKCPLINNILLEKTDVTLTGDLNRSIGVAETMDRVHTVKTEGSTLTKSEEKPQIKIYMSTHETRMKVYDAGCRLGLVVRK